MTDTDRDLDTRLQAARRPTPEIRSATAAMLARETRDHARRRRHRFAFATAAGAVALGIGAVTAGPAVASSVQAFLAQSGWTSEGTEVIENSEFIDTGAPDLADYLDTVFPDDLPLAPGQTRAGVIDEVVDAQTPALRQEVGLRRDIERAVRLGWLSEWLHAHADGDTARMTEASQVLVASLDWPAFVATDGGGVMAQDAAFLRAVADGDAEAARAFAQFDGAPFWDGTDRSALIETILEDVR